MKKYNSTALVVLSGGQDSVTCLGAALGQYMRVHAISFVYGQRHVAELDCAKHLCLKYVVPHKVLDLTFMPDLVQSALLTTADKWAVGQPHKDMPEVPSSFVPGRNALFLTLAHAYAQTIKSDCIMTGVCQTDYSGYPDCRAPFVGAMEHALNRGYGTDIGIRTPMMHLTKADTFLLASQHGFLEEVLLNSHTCYEGDHTTFNEWGYGCGKCPACELRKKGWEEFKAAHRDTAELALSNVAFQTRGES